MTMSVSGVVLRSIASKLTIATRVAGRFFCYRWRNYHSADYVVTESRTLADGTLIENTLAGQFAQDGSNRTYLRFDTWALITDPIAGYVWQINVPAGVALQSQTGASGGPDADSIEFGDLESSDSSLQVNIPAFTEQAPSSEDLGTRTQIWCTKHRDSLDPDLFPAGVLGNDNPIQVEGDMWVSDDFGFTLVAETVTQDPLSGTHSVALSSIAGTTFEADYFRPGREVHYPERGLNKKTCPQERSCLGHITKVAANADTFWSARNAP